jgi:enediyne polyketide synthase
VRIAIVGIGLRCPDATSPEELWENVLAGRAPCDNRSTGTTANQEAGNLENGTVTRALADAGHFGRRTQECTVDGAGTPSLRSVAAAAQALTDGELDIALAGGPHHTANPSAAPGCSVLVLMRERDALAEQRRVYASVTRWGAAAAGDGPRLAVARDNPQTVSCLDGHAAPRGGAGLTGLVTAALAVYHQVIPPSGPRGPRPAKELSAQHDAAPWPAGRPVRADVFTTADGTQVTIEEAPGRERRATFDKRTTALVANRQDAELLLVDAPDAAAMRERAAHLARLVTRLAPAELTDLAGTLAAEQTGRPCRAALVAGDPAEAARALTRVRDALAGGRAALHDPADGVFLGHRERPPRIAYLFPGDDRGAAAASVLRRRFRMADSVFRHAPVPLDTARPRVAACSLAGLRVLESLGIEAAEAGGYGIGRLTALSWAGALDGGDLLRVAADERPDRFALRAPRRRVVTVPDRGGDAPATAFDGADLAITVGPGRAGHSGGGRSPGTLAVVLDTSASSLRPLLGVAGAAYALGADVDPTILFADRAVRLLAEDLAPATSGTDHVPATRSA